MKYPKLNNAQMRELRNIIDDDSNSNKEIKRAQIILMLDKKKELKILKKEKSQGENPKIEVSNKKENRSI